MFNITARKNVEVPSLVDRKLEPGIEARETREIRSRAQKSSPAFFVGGTVDSSIPSAAFGNSPNSKPIFHKF